MFDAGKTRMIGLPCGEMNYDNILSRFHPIPERHGRTDRQTDGRTERQTGRIAISITRVSVLTRDKNRQILMKCGIQQQIWISMTVNWPNMKIFKI